jgi:hypothetical protein
MWGRGGSRPRLNKNKKTKEMKTGSIDLAAALIIPTEGYAGGSASVITAQMKSTDLSANTEYSLEVSGDTVDWDIAEFNGDDITETLVSGVAKVRSFEVDPKIYWRISFASGATGTVAYKLFE